MDKVFEFLPENLPAWAYISITIIFVIGLLLLAKISGNSNKQSIGSKNTFSGDTKINQQIGRDITNHKDKEES